jgi:hypothetical protein
VSFFYRIFAKEVEEERNYNLMMNKVLDVSVKEALIQVRLTGQCHAMVI